VTTITSPGVDGSTTDDPTPSFEFSANEIANFTCKVDAQAAEGCTSPFTTPPLPDGPHSLTVVAADSVGNVEGLPPTRTLTIDTSSSGSSHNATCHGKEATKIGTGHSETIRGTAKADVIVGEGGDDKLIGADGNDTICGGEGDDKLVGGDGKDALFGEEGDDRLKGGPKHDKLKGGPGHNTVIQ
jgi:Ca2+-binding RTX toxin-like protein